MPDDAEIENRIFHSRAGEPGRGREALRPTHIPLKGWRDIVWRTYTEMNNDRLSLVAAGVTFYVVLALFPAIGAFVSLYGLLADPGTVQQQLNGLAGFVPPALIDIVSDELKRVSSGEPSSLSFAFAGGLAFALWSANKGVAAIFDSMNVVYDEPERRGYFMLTAQTLAFTTGAIILLIVLINVMVVVPNIFDHVLAMFGLSTLAGGLLGALPFVLAILLMGAAVTLVYRFGASRAPARWRWLSVGSVFATIAWAATSGLFTWYMAHFADYNATYGSLGAVIGMMMWIWLSTFVVLLGAELNAEIEHQTARDTTTGAEAPLGSRGARMADTVGEAQ